MSDTEVKPYYPRRYDDLGGIKEWYLVSKGPFYIHNENGPAREHIAGGRLFGKEWWLNNKLIGTGDCPPNWEELVLLAQLERFLDE